MIAQPVEKMLLEMVGRMTQNTQNKSCWEDLGLHIVQGLAKTRDIIFKLQDIEMLLLKQLPTLKRDK